jgi:hypothetical protein
MLEEQKPSSVERQKAKCKLGKITNKYLIIEIYAFAYGSREEAMYRMFKYDRMQRNLLIEQYNKALQINIPY